MSDSYYLLGRKVSRETTHRQFLKKFTFLKSDSGEFD
jgi:hypothetical protein